MKEKLFNVKRHGRFKIPFRFNFNWGVKNTVVVMYNAIVNIERRLYKIERIHSRSKNLFHNPSTKRRRVSKSKAVRRK